MDMRPLKSGLRVALGGLELYYAVAIRQTLSDIAGRRRFIGS